MCQASEIKNETNLFRKIIKQFIMQFSSHDFKKHKNKSKKLQQFNCLEEFLKQNSKLETFNYMMSII